MQRKCIALLMLCFLALGCRSGMVTAAEPGLVDPNVPEFTTTESGLRYRVLREGDGEMPTEADTVTVHYKGWLPISSDNNIFDSSYERDRPATFRLDQVVDGWTEGLQHVREGGMIELEIPASLGYGARGTGEIPPNSTLCFLVELIEIQ